MLGLKVGLQKGVGIICMLLLASLSTLAMAQASKPPMPAREAFVLSTTIIPPNDIVLNWRIAPGTYLYRDKVHITFSPDAKAVILFPKGEMKKDPNRGNIEVYSGDLRIPVHLTTDVTKYEMHVAYQGCSHEGFCYPPVKNTISINLTDGIASQDDLVKLNSLVTNQERVQALLSAGSFGTTLLVFLGIGFLLSLTPCVLPMIPILTGIIVGQKGYVSTRKAFFLSLMYVLGMAITYAAVGMIAALFGSSIQVWLQKPLFILLGSAIFAVLAVGLLGLYELRISHHWQNWVTSWSNQHQSGTFFGVFSMGVLSSLILSPCVTAPLVGVLMYIGQSGSLVLGASALFMMAMGMGIPLLIVGMSAGNWLPKTGPWMEAVKKGFGFLMLGMAIWIASRVLPMYAVSFLTSLLLFLMAAYFVVYMPQLIGRPLLNRSAGVVSVILGLAILIGGPGLMNHLNPWGGSALSQQENGFMVVRSLSELDEVLTEAKSLHQPAILDFYADWCESCIEMDRQVLNDPQIKQMLAKFVLIRADLSANSSEDEALLKKYAIVAPPTLLFFNADGQEVGSRRIVGGLDIKELASRLDLFMAEGCDKKEYC